MTDIEIRVVVPFAWQTLCPGILGPRYKRGSGKPKILSHMGEVNLPRNALL